jgi:hypothetical protein
MKNIIFLFMLTLCSWALKAQVTETNEGGDIQQIINTLFQNVDVSQANTGFLVNKAIYFTNIHQQTLKMVKKESYLGRSPSDRAMHYNAFLPQAQHKKTFPLLSLTRGKMR